jgi:hypothetical protein
MENINSLLPLISVALSGFCGAIFGAVLGPIVEHWATGRRQRSRWRRLSLMSQLNNVYRPLYEKYVVMPRRDPEHYFSDWGPAEFTEWLQGALAVC